MTLNGNVNIVEGLISDGIAKQKLHVMMVIDTSRSMQGKRIDQVNSAIADIHKYLVDFQSENVNVDFYVSIMTFSNRAEFVPGYKAINVNDMKPPKLKAIGYSNLHCAYEELAVALHKESAGGIMPDFGGIAPIILLITDGHPSKSTEKELADLKKLPWFCTALRYGIAIELNDERTMRVLSDFTEDPECVVKCIDSDVLAKIIRVIVVTASKVKSQSSAVRANNKARYSIRTSNGIPYVCKTDMQVQIKQQINNSLDEIDEWEW